MLIVCSPCGYIFKPRQVPGSISLMLVTSSNIAISGTIFRSGAPDARRYIGVIVISKIVISGFCPIHFIVTFAGI